MKGLILKEFREHWISGFIAMITGSVMMVFAFFGFFINANLKVPGNNISNLTPDQMKMIHSFISALAKPNNILLALFYSSFFVILIYSAILGINMWSGEFKFNSVEFLFSSGAKYRRILSAKFISGIFIMGVAVLLNGIFSVILWLSLYAKIFSDTKLLKLLKIHAQNLHFISGVWIILKVFPLYLLGVSIFFSVSFASGFIMKRKSWALKVVPSLLLYLVWGVLWNYLFGFQNTAINEFHKGLLIHSPSLFSKLSFSNLYANTGNLSSLIVLAGIFIALVFDFLLLHFADKAVLSKDKI